MIGMIFLQEYVKNKQKQHNIKTSTHSIYCIMLDYWLSAVMALRKGEPGARKVKGGHYLVSKL